MLRLRAGGDGLKVVPIEHFEILRSSRDFVHSCAMIVRISIILVEP